MIAYSYLASDESKYVTGTLLTVDGGATSHQPVLPRTMLASEGR